MNKTRQMKPPVLVVCAMVTLLIFVSNARANFVIVDGVSARYPNGVIDKSTGFTMDCKSCHVKEPILPPYDSTRKPNVQDAYNADKVNYTGLINLIQGCPAGSTANPTQPWVCEGAAPTPTLPPPSLPTACDDDANTPACSNLPNQYGSVGSADSGAEMTDVYTVKCGKKTKAIKVSVSDLAPDNPAKVSIQALKGSGKSPVSTDAVDGDGGYSRPVKLALGSGIYLVKVKKSSSETAGAEIYDAQIMCVGGKKGQTKSAIAIKDNH